MKTFSIIALLFTTLLYSCNKDALNKNATSKPGTVKITNGSGTLTVYPSSGITFGAVKIVGSGFDTLLSNNVVKFNGVEGIVNYASPTVIVATIPANATTGNITVTTRGITQTSTSSFKVMHLVKEGSITSPIKIQYAAVDRLGKGIIYASDSSHIYEIDPNGVKKILYTVPPEKKVIYNGASEGLDSLYTINGLTTDNAGNLYAGRNLYATPLFNPNGWTITRSTILKIDPNGNVTPLTSGAVEGLPYVAPQFGEIHDITIDAANKNMYITDRYDFCIRKLTTTSLSIFAGYTEWDNSPVKDSPADSAAFNDHYLSNLALDNNNNLYITDYNIIRKVANNRVTTVGGWYAGFGTKDGQGTYDQSHQAKNYASFETPTSIAVDAANNLFIMDRNVLRIMNPAYYVSSYNTGLTYHDNGLPYSDNSVLLVDQRTGKLYIAVGNVIQRYSYQ